MWVFFFLLQSKNTKCFSAAPESPTVNWTKRASENKTSFSASAMKSEGIGTANKPGESPSSKAKNGKKTGDRSAAPKVKATPAATPVINGTGTAGAKRGITSANGPRSSHGSKDQEKKLNLGARPKTSPPSCTSSAVARAPKSSAEKNGCTSGNIQAQPGATSASGSSSPENDAISGPNDPGLWSLLPYISLLWLSHITFHCKHSRDAGIVKTCKYCHVCSVSSVGFGELVGSSFAEICACNTFFVF